MSHHLDSPIARQDVRLDTTDLYVFPGESGTVFAVNVCHSLAGDIPTPGFHPEGMYEFKIDLDGDDVEDVTYRFVFDERDSEGAQAYQLHRVAGAKAVDPNAPGAVIAEGVTGREAQASGRRIWAGKAGDPFWIDPDLLHQAGHAVHDGTKIDLSAWDESKAENVFAGHTVYSIVLELPDTDLVSTSADGTIGVWAVATLATDSGGWRSINRIGLPMIHPLFAQYDDDLGDRLNAGIPSEDYSIYSDAVIERIAAIVEAYGTAQDPRAYAERVAHRFFPNILHYRVGTPAAFDFLEWNGRTMTDNAADVMFSIATNHPVTTGVGKESVTRKPRATFPYVPAV
ncbi:DUF4331 domain-containing protein [Herbiconiux sp. CPCC 205763]|uniref:DUF4331 domain-containing protein n=1 Tax=Herbiconiux aconitum TaxID=2970913 RepID=A0ABT2GVT0_9MICO|nr:DUF4331 domain-containing protein [Herbiconiux aconitum]MCS5720326.1 DUF4331 domain-containing protein [Herbiconiux aconitum]